MDLRPLGVMCHLNPAPLVTRKPLRPAQCAVKGRSSQGRLGQWLALAARLEMQPCLLQVPKVVRSIYRWLKRNTEAAAEAELQKTLLELTLASPHAVVVTLLRCAPSCDRYVAQLP